jgi:hypothetical protein
MMSRIDSRHWTISTGRHFQNGRHNTAKIQHCPISSNFDMWVDNDVPNWFPILKNFYRSPFSKWPPRYRTNSTLSDFNVIWYVGRLWRPELIPDIVGTSLSTHISNFYDIGQCWIFTAHFLYHILAAILKMADISKFWKRRITPLMVTYHYVKF